MSFSEGSPSHAVVTSHEVAAALMAEHAPAVVGLVDADERIADVGGVLLARLGYERAEWLGRPLVDLVDDVIILELVRRGIEGEAGARTTVLNGQPWMVAVRPAEARPGLRGGCICVLTYADETDVRRRLSAREADLERFAALVELSKDFIAMADFDGTVTFLNRAGRELVGAESDEEALGRPTADYFTDKGLAKSQEIEDAVRDRGYWEGESELRHLRTGESIPVSVNSFLVTRSSDGVPLALATVQRDLRSRLEIERRMALRVQEQRDLAELGSLALNLSLAELTREVVARIVARFPDMVSGVLARNAEADQLLTVASAMDSWENRVIRVLPGTLSGFALAENRAHFTPDLDADGRYESEFAAESQTRSALVCPVPGPDGPWGLIGLAGAEPHEWQLDEVAFVESVAATLGAAVRRAELENELQHQALHDSLTGLPNRALALDRIDRALLRSRASHEQVTVLLLDLDDFKAVNDSLGHGVGDRLLSRLARRFAAVVGDEDTVARLGGDEFVVVVESARSDQEIAFLAESLLTACSEALVLDERRLSVSASIGVAHAVGSEADLTRLLAEADIAMYAAKRDRPGTYRVFDEAMRGDVLGRMNIAGELREALRSDALTVAYQPIVALESDLVVALEALARWTNDAGDVVSPDVFIPLAEETGLIGELGIWVLREAARQAAVWRAAGHDVQLRVNVSAHELRSPRYVETVMSTLEAAGIPPDVLGLEVTESTLVDDDKTTQDNLVRLSDAGVCLLVDDFGTGYSSLSYLERFPVVDVLKIDRSFLTDGHRGRAVVQAVVGLARAFEFQTCAEGVETPEQLAFLREQGCDLVQGFYLARPVPADQVADLLARWQMPTR